MPRLLPAVLAITAMVPAWAPAAAVAWAWATPAGATWLQCSATGTTTDGPFAYETTTADVGTLDPVRLDTLKKRLAAYVAKTDAEAKTTAVECSTAANENDAVSHYSHFLHVTARRLGWEHVNVVAANAWLSDKDIVEDPTGQ